MFFVRCRISKTSFLQSDLNFEFRWCFSFSKVKIITASNAYANNIKPNIIQLRSLIWAGTKVRLDQLGSLTSYHLGLNEKRFFKSKWFDVCTDFTKVSLEIRPRVISRGLIIFLCRSKVSNLSWSGPTPVPASLISRQKAMLANKHILSFTLDRQLKRNQVLWRVYQMGKSQWKGERFFYIAWILIHLLYFFCGLHFSLVSMTLRYQQ